MPAADNSDTSKSFQDVIDDLGLYPPEAFEFVQEGLSHVVVAVHGEKVDPEADRHITGKQLCEGLRDFALGQYGLMARIVLRRWNITTTYDFGRIIFALVDNGFMQKTDRDTIDDFRNVYTFDQAFEAGYRIGIGT